MTGTALAQSLGILALPIATRLFAPEAFGIATLFSSMTTIIGVVACLRYELAIMLPESHVEAANILGVSLLSVFFITVLSILIIYLSGDIIVCLFKVPQLKKYLWLVPVAIFFQGIFLALNYWNTRTKHYGRLSVAQIVSSLTDQVTKLAAGFAGFVSGGVLIGTTILGNIVAAMALGGQIWRDDRRLFLSNLSWKGVKKGLVRYKKFPIFETWAGLLNTISWQLPALMLSSFFNMSIVGFYSLGLMIVQAPLALIGNALYRVFYQKACQNKNTQKGNKEFVENLMDKLIFIGMLPMILMAMIAEDLFVVLFGETWGEAGRYAQILTPWLMFVFISSPLSSLFAVYERQGTALFLQCLIFSTRLISLYIGGIHQNVYLALGLFSLTGVVTYGAYAMLNMKFANANIRKICLSFVKEAGYCLPAAAAILYLKYLLGFDRLVLLIATLIFVALHIFLFRHKYFTLLPQRVLK